MDTLVARQFGYIAAAYTSEENYEAQDVVETAFHTVVEDLENAEELRDAFLWAQEERLKMLNDQANGVG